MELGDSIIPTSADEESLDIDVSRRHLASLSGQGQFLIAIGAAEDVLAAFGVRRSSPSGVRVVVTATKTSLRRPDGPESPGPPVVWVRPDLHFDSADIGRVRRQITYYEPKVVVIEGHTASASDDSQWAQAIVDGWQTPGVLALAADPLYDVATAVVPNTAVEPQLPRAARHVNTVVQRVGDSTTVAPGDVLEADTDYLLGVGIGPRRADSLLGGDASFPDEILGRRARRLDVYLEHLNASTLTTQHRHVYLPEDGPAFTCPTSDQLPDTTEWEALDHRLCAETHHELAQFEVPRRSSPGVLRFDVLIYVNVAVVHVQRVELSVVEGPGAIARVTYRLLYSFDDLPDLTDRAASVTEGEDHLTVNGVGYPRSRSGGAGGSFGFRADKAQWHSAAVDVREQLTARHFHREETGWQPLYPDVDVPRKEYGDSLLRVADLGRVLFNQLFNTSESRELAPMLQHEARARGRPAVIQIARTVQRPFVIPWQILYELPLEHPELGVRVCPAVDEYGPGGTGEWPPPASCPHGEDHDRALAERPRRAFLCPYGFWGMAHILEIPEPPPGRRSLDHIVTDSTAQPTMVTGIGADLNDKLLKTHLSRMGSQAPGIASTPDSPLTDATEFLDALTPSTMDVVYLLSHCKRTGPSERTHALVFADQKLTSDDVAVWARDEWPKDHWAGRRPLVLLNACYTAEITASTMAGFVTNFVAAGASGVVGTETLVEQNVASSAMESFLTDFAAGSTAGEAVRLMRWRLLRRGNLLGFSYTPYCAADLRLRPSP
ncbi:CHAT domain-containing protein [Streptomyces sp. NPDC058671]|uniref:CHAT domain-containing protein n=1 Tax=Streptomyces sp. NPDC058671 TaxID=3346590 RepID=UPI0036586364